MYLCIFSLLNTISINFQLSLERNLKILEDGLRIDVRSKSTKYVHSCLLNLIRELKLCNRHDFRIIINVRNEFLYGT